MRGPETWREVCFKDTGKEMRGRGETQRDGETKRDRHGERQREREREGEIEMKRRTERNKRERERDESYESGRLVGSPGGVPSWEMCRGDSGRT